MLEQIPGAAAPIAKASSGSEIPHIQGRAQEFMGLLDAIVVLLQDSDISVTAYHGSHAAHFSRLTNEQQVLAFKNAEDLLMICEAALRFNHRIHDEAFSMLWFMLKKFGLRFPSDLFSRLESTDVVEIYGADNVQMFRSFNMFSFITYTLEEIFTHNWSELWDRDESLVARMWTISNDVFKGKLKGILTFDIPDHLVVEKFSGSRRKTYMQHRFILPLIGSDGRVTALMNVIRPIEMGI